MKNFSFRWLISVALSFLATLYHKHIAPIKPRPTQNSPFNSRIDIDRKYTRAKDHFIVIGTQKSGSTYLRKLISANGMVGLPEAFRKEGASAARLKALYADREPGEIVSSTLHFDQIDFPAEADRLAFFSYLKENDISVVFLIRGLSVFILLSWLSQTIDRISKAMRLKRFTDEDIRRYEKQYSSLSDHAKFYVDRSYFSSFENELSEMYEEAISTCKKEGIQFSVIYYEDICEESELRKIFSEVFGVETLTHDVGMLKRHDSKLSDIIS
ncbi:MAG: hypothetical protein P8Q97_19265 [Myxococcota bacterium]|jgi:hypothetical protein|nr:hypothetical protein [Myxococcota bacterium]